MSEFWKAYNSWLGHKELPIPSQGVLYFLIKTTAVLVRKNNCKNIPAADLS